MIKFMQEDTLEAFESFKIEKPIKVTGLVSYLNQVEEAFDFNSFREKLYEVMSVLNPKEKGLLYLRYGFLGRDYTLDEIAEIDGTTHQNIRQIQARALKKLRDSPIAKELRYFL